MSQVLLRVFPDRPRKGVSGMQKGVEVEGEYKDGDPFRLHELSHEFRVEKRSSVVPEGYDYALHFIVPAHVMGRFSEEAGWAEITGCTTCPRE